MSLKTTVEKCLVPKAMLWEAAAGLAFGHAFNSIIIVDNHAAPSINPCFLSIYLMNWHSWNIGLKMKIFKFHYLRGVLHLFKIITMSDIILQYLFCYFDGLLRCFGFLILFTVIHFNSWLQIKWILVYFDVFIN